MKKAIILSALVVSVATTAAVVHYGRTVSSLAGSEGDAKEPDGPRTTGTSPCQMDPNEKAVFYLTHVLTGRDWKYEWRVYQPATGQDVFFLALDEKPESIFWDKAFTLVRFRIKDSLYEYSWACQPQLRQKIAIPDEVIEASVPIGRRLDSDIWLDEQTSTWRFATLKTLPTGGPVTYLQRLWEYTGGKWSLLEEKKGPYAPFGHPKGGSTLTLKDLQESMYFRAEEYEKELQGRDENNKLIYLPTRTDKNRGLKVKIEHGEEAFHPTVPLIYVNQEAGTEEVICDEGASPGSMVTFAEYKHFVLVSCGVGPPLVLDMRTGEILQTLLAGRHTDERGTIHAYVPEVAVWVQPLKRDPPLL